MRILLFLMSITVACSCQPTSTSKEPSTYLSVSPAIDTNTQENKAVVKVIEGFFNSKNQSLNQNEYWLDSDFEKLIYPYFDIYEIEKSSREALFYKPSLMELIEIENGDRLVKVGFVGVHSATQQTTIRCIYNLIATQINGEWKLRNSLFYFTKSWNSIKHQSITYHLPPNKTPNQHQVELQLDDINQLSQFFNTSPIPIDYYSCESPKQVFQIKGFDYLPNMYFSDKGGKIDFANNVFSGNNSEYYTHEIVHIYTKILFPNLPRLLDEGLATYIGGSGSYSYNWHRKALKNELNQLKDFTNYLQTYSRDYINEETPIPYMVGALICERTLKKYGKKGLIELLNSKGTLWETIAPFGLNKANFNAELVRELSAPYHPIF